VEAKGPGDSLLDRGTQFLTRNEFHDPPEKVVAVVAVRPFLTGPRDRGKQRLRREQLLDRAACKHLPLDGWRGEAIGETARVVEDLSDGDLVAIGHARDPFGYVVVERQLALAGKLKDQVGGERLWLAILNCMSVLRGASVARSATPLAMTKVPCGLQIPTRTPGVWFVSWN
jgi:hypothetical protein